MYKCYKVRLYPTKEQELQIINHINCCRFIWNYMLNLQETEYRPINKVLTAYDMSNILTELKDSEKYIWLNDVSRTSLCDTFKDLHRAYKEFFKGTRKHPKFKSKKKSKLSYPVRGDRHLYFRDNWVQIEKVGKVKINPKSLKYVPSGKMSKIRIIKQSDKWILLFYVDSENQTKTENNGKSMGIDLGVKELAVVSYDNEKLVFHNINKSSKMKKLERKLKHLQRNVSRKYETNYRKNGNWEKTNNIIKYEKMIKEIYYRMANIRQNYIHQTTSALIKLQPSKVVMEDLNVKGMVKNKYLSKAILSQCFNEFTKQMQQKCEWNNIEFIKANKMFPSSKICSCCGCKKDKLSLSVRIYKCDNCGLIIDRDYNAAINLMNYVV